MFIHEAIKARTPAKPYITRAAWSHQRERSLVPIPRIFPTDTPDCCVLISGASKPPCRGWQPIAEDLIADDWETVA